MNRSRFLAMTAALGAAGGLVLTACSSSSTGAAAGSVSSAATTGPATSATSAPAISSAAVASSSSARSASAGSSAPTALTSFGSSPAVTATDLKTATSSLGPLVVTANGMTVYFFQPDVPNSGKSACSGECLAAWPAVIPSGPTATGAGITGKLGVITRTDGMKQVTIDGRPIYLFAGDKAPGDVKGQGIKEVWFAVTPSGEQIDPKTTTPMTTSADLKVTKSKLGQTIVTAKGMTVYYFKPDVPNSGKSACSGECLQAWPAVTPASTSATGSGISAKLGVITRTDGTKQITVGGRPIYLFAGDKAPGDVKGQDVKGVWYAVAPAGTQIGS